MRYSDLAYDAVIGGDPGASGAFVRITKDRQISVVRFQNHTWKQVADWVLDQQLTSSNKALLEQIAAMPTDSRSSAHAFGINTGVIKGILIAHGILFEEINPQVWQREFRLGGKYKNKTERKRAHQARARELFPQFADRMTLDVCDAFLIAEYAWRVQYGELTYGRETNRREHGDQQTYRQGTGIRWDTDKSLP